MKWKAFVVLFLSAFFMLGPDAVLITLVDPMHITPDSIQFSDGTNQTSAATEGAGLWSGYSSPADHIKARHGGIATNDATLIGDKANTHINLGFDNSVTGSDVYPSSHCTVSGGSQNTASGFTATISGGFFNTASGSNTTVGGG